MQRFELRNGDPIFGVAGSCKEIQTYGKVKVLRVGQEQPTGACDSNFNGFGVEDNVFLVTGRSLIQTTRVVHWSNWDTYLSPWASTRFKDTRFLSIVPIRKR